MRARRSLWLSMGIRRIGQSRLPGLWRQQAGKLALFFLPPYSPELNPDEFVWNDLKNHGTGRKLITSLSQLRQTVVSHMRQLQKLPDLVRSFFHAPATRYARA